MRSSRTDKQNESIMLSQLPSCSSPEMRGSQENNFWKFQALRESYDFKNWIDGWVFYQISF